MKTVQKLSNKRVQSYPAQTRAIKTPEKNLNIRDYRFHEIKVLFAERNSTRLQLEETFKKKSEKIKNNLFSEIVCDVT